MSLAAWGALIGLTASCGLLLTARRVLAIKRTQIGLRVLPHLHDVPQLGSTLRRYENSSAAAAAAGVFGPPLRRAADVVDQIMGGSRTVSKQLVRAGLDLSVQEFRIQQVIWGLIGFALAAAWGLLRTFTGHGQPVLAAVLCVVAFALGMISRDWYLGSQVSSRERKIIAEFPTLAELLALSVAAGEGVVNALERVVSRSGGEFSRDLAEVLARIRTGEPVGAAFEAMADASGLAPVARFGQAISVAVERGTPLADVLHAQAGDVRETRRRDLIETAARKEVAMMAPVVFLVLPISIVFAFFPGVIGLSLAVP